MAPFPLCKTTAGPVRVSRTQLVLYCVLLSLIIYFLRARRAAVVMHPPHPVSQALEAYDDAEKTTESGETPSQAPLETPWGAPLVWGDSSDSAGRRAEFAQQGVRTGLLALVVGTYAKFVRRFLQSAETYFLPGQAVTYYILTDNPRVLEPPVKLGPQRQLTVVPVAELPGWQRLAYRRMALIADAIGNLIGKEVDYLFCADVDQVFVETVGQEILGDLVATLHPELYAMPRGAFPYEIEEDSTARVADDEGDYYYTSELYGGLLSEVRRLARACARLILRDQANGVAAKGLEESYLNRYLINHKPTCVLSPEYNWWDSALSTDVPVQRIVSLGRQCEALDKEKREELHC